MFMVHLHPIYYWFPVYDFTIPISYNLSDERLKNMIIGFWSFWSTPGRFLFWLRNEMNKNYNSAILNHFSVAYSKINFLLWQHLLFYFFCKWEWFCINHPNKRKKFPDHINCWYFYITSKKLYFFTNNDKYFLNSLKNSIFLCKTSKFMWAEFVLVNFISFGCLDL